MINIIKSTNAIALALILSACSSSPEDVTQITSEANVEKSSQASTGSIEEHMAEWQEIKPSLERLVLIEAELKTLIQEMAKMTAEQKKSIEAQKEKETLIITPVPKPTPIPTPIAESRYSKHALQIFTVDNKELLETSWERWSKKHTTTLDDYAKIYHKAEKNGISYYRIKISNFTSKQEALDTCVKIKKHGDDCFLTNNLGQKF